MNLTATIVAERSPYVCGDSQRFWQSHPHPRSTAPPVNGRLDSRRRSAENVGDLIGCEREGTRDRIFRDEQHIDLSCGSLIFNIS